MNAHTHSDKHCAALFTVSWQTVQGKARGARPGVQGKRQGSLKYLLNITRAASDDCAKERLVNLKLQRRDLRCILHPSTLVPGARCKTRLEYRMKRFDPHFIYDCFLM